MDLDHQYHDKDEIKELGARWDPTRRKWWVPAGRDLRLFARWNPQPAPVPRRAMQAPSAPPMEPRPPPVAPAAQAARERGGACSFASVCCAVAVAALAWGLMTIIGISRLMAGRGGKMLLLSLLGLAAGFQPAAGILRRPAEAYVLGQRALVSSGGRKQRKLGGMSLEEALVLPVARLQFGSVAPETLNGYLSDFKHWRTFFAERIVGNFTKYGPIADGFPYLLPTADPVVKALHVDIGIEWMVDEMFLRGLKYSSARAKLTGFRHFHYYQAEGEDPFHGSRRFNMAMRAAKRQKGGDDNEPKVPALPSLVEYAVACLDRESWVGATMAAALNVGLAFALRAGEYLATDGGVFDPRKALRWADVTFIGPDGESCAPAAAVGVRIHVKFCKNDQQGRGAYRTLYKESEDHLLGVVTALQRLDRHWPKSDHEQEHVFTRPASGGKGKLSSLRRCDVSRVLQKAAKAAGLPKGSLASHSLRRGAATVFSALAAEGKLDRETIRVFCRWLGIESLNRYTETLRSRYRGFAGAINTFGR